MKIALIGPAHPLRGGIANFNEALARSLQQQGHQVRIYSFSLQYPGILFPGKSQKTTDPAPAGLDIQTCINSVNPLSWWQTARRIKKWQPDLAIVRFWMPFMGPSLGTIAGSLKRAGIPVIAITDNVIPHEKRKGDKLLTRYFLKRCNSFVAMSDSVATDMKSFLPNARVTVTPHPVYDIFGEAVSREEALKNLELDPINRYLLFFGLIRKYKGLDLLLKGFARAVPEIPENVVLIIAGEFYSDRDETMQMIQSLNLEKRVVLHDRYIPEAQVKHYFCAADLLAQTYLSATQSGVTQIGYHFGVPMLVTNVGGLPEIVSDNVTGFVTEVDENAVGQAIVRFFNGNQHAEMAENVCAARGRFSWHTFVDKLLSMQ
jgi:glycosyltransferase involved in cell wall biosynthesis